MAFIDLILNLAGVLLWLNWRAVCFDPLAKSTPASLVWTLKPTEARPWTSRHFLGALGVLLLLRAWLYWQIGSALGWTPSLQLGAIAVSFRSDFFPRILLYSVLSFVAVLAVLYSWLLLLSLANSRTDGDPMHRWVRLHLGRIDRWHWSAKLFIPLVTITLLWFLVSFLLSKLGIIPVPRSAGHRLGEALVVGSGAYLTWKYLIGVLLALYLISSYVYFGNHAVWSYIGLTGKNLVRPLQWAPLQLGRVSFAPVVGIALVFLASEAAERGLELVYKQLLR